MSGQAIPHENRDFFTASFKIAGATLRVPENRKRPNKHLQSFPPFDAVWPEERFIEVWPPPAIACSGSPSDAVVACCLGAGHGIAGVCQTRKNCFQFRVHDSIDPCCRPHSIQSVAIRSMRPRCSGETGLIPVIAFNAQNHRCGDCWSSRKINGRTGGPIPIIRWYDGCEQIAETEDWYFVADCHSPVKRRNSRSSARL